MALLHCVSSVVVGEQLTFITSAIDAITTGRNARSSKFNRCSDVPSCSCSTVQYSSGRLDPDVACDIISRISHASEAAKRLLHLCCRSAVSGRVSYSHKTKPYKCLSIFTCISYAEARNSYRLDVCPSVRLSVRLSVRHTLVLYQNG